MVMDPNLNGFSMEQLLTFKTGQKGPTDVVCHVAILWEGKK